jgi:hypothetical protein
LAFGASSGQNKPRLKSAETWQFALKLSCGVEVRLRFLASPAGNANTRFHSNNPGGWQRLIRAPILSGRLWANPDAHSLRRWQQLRVVFRGGFFGFRLERGLRGSIERWGRRRPVRDGNADGHEKLFLTGR